LNIIEEYKLKESKYGEEIRITYLKNVVGKAVRQIHFGIKELEEINFVNSDNYDFIFLFLSRGFELLMKSMICFKNYEDDESFPTEKEMKDMGHDLDKLRKKIIRNYDKIPENASEKYQEIKNDKKFISNDDTLIKLIKLLTNFSKSGRYFDLDFITKKEIFKQRNGKRIIDYSNAPISKMRILVHNYVVKNHPSLENPSNFDDLNNPWLEANRLYIIPPLKKFIGALARQFSLGILGDEAKECISKSKYLYLNSKDYKVEDRDLDN
jgi:hypothetical protein